MSASLLIERRNQYLEYLLDALRSPLHRRVSEWMEAIVADKKKKPQALKHLQDVFAKVSGWNSLRVASELAAVVKDDDIDYLPKLVTALITVETKLFLLDEAVDSKDVTVRPPTLDAFVHQCFIESARLLWKNIALFDPAPGKLEQQKNFVAVDGLIAKAVKDAVRKLLPIKDIVGHMPTFVPPPPSPPSPPPRPTPTPTFTSKPLPTPVPPPEDDLNDGDLNEDDYDDFDYDEVDDEQTEEKEVDIGGGMGADKVVADKVVAEKVVAIAEKVPTEKVVTIAEKGNAEVEGIDVVGVDEEEYDDEDNEDNEDNEDSDADNEEGRVNSESITPSTTSANPDTKSVTFNAATTPTSASIEVKKKSFY